MSDPAIANARMKPASSPEIATGLLGYCAFDYGSIRLSATLRRTASSSRLYLSYPSRIVNGRRVPHIEPLDQAARDRIERAVLEQLGFSSRRRA